MEVLGDLLSLISIHTHLMFLWSLSNSRLVHAFVFVMVVISYRPFFHRSLPTTHRDARMKSSIAMVKASEHSGGCLKSDLPYLLYLGAKKVLSLQENREPLGHTTEENLSFHIH